MAAVKPQDKIADYEIEQLRPEHNFSGLSLGAPAFTPLKIFAKKSAQKFEQANLTRTYVVSVGGKQKGYISILCGEVVSKNGDQLVGDELDYRYNQYPAVKIARLAVDKSLKGKKIGTELVDLALGITLEYICPNIGCRFIVVDAKKESIGFYEKYGFTILDTPENKAREAPIMYIDLMKI